MRAAGFTLLELLVVLAILGLMTALMLPARAPLLSAEGAARLIAADLAHARARAIAGNSEVTVSFDVDGGIWRGGGRHGRLPAHLRLALTAAATEGAAIRFYPEGGASGGRLVISGPGRAEILVDWLTGGVSIHEP